MKKPLLALALTALAATAALAQANDTLGKIKSTGTVTMGVRESSGVLSYTLGDGKYTGYHVEICQRVLGDIQKRLPSRSRRFRAASPRWRLGPVSLWWTAPVTPRA